MNSDSRNASQIESLRRAAERNDAGYLLEAMKGASLEVRTVAIDLLGGIGGERARLVLVRIARDRWGERPELRIAALGALKSLMEEERYTGLLEEFITAENRKVVTAARGMLKKVDPEGLSTRLVERGALDHAAMKVYGMSREASAVPLLGAYLAERLEAGDVAVAGNWGKVYAAVRALGNIAGASAVETLEGVLARLAETPRPEDGTLAAARFEKIETAARQALERAE